MREAEDFQHKRDDDARHGAENGTELEPEREQDKTRYTQRGAIPTVAADGDGNKRLSASEQAELGGSWGGLLDGASNLLGDAFDTAEDAPEVKATNGLFGGLFGDDEEKKPPPTMKSKTLFHAAGAPGTRTKVGVGESVDLSSDQAGQWSASGDGQLLGGKGSSQAYWRAPNRAGTTTITLDVDGQKVQKTFEVVAPEQIHYRYHSRGYIDPYTAGVSMKMSMDLDPLDVSFGGIEVKEQPGPANDRGGYFLRVGASEENTNHNPNPDWSGVTWNNRVMGLDTAWIKADPLPAKDGGGYMAGHVVWKIPHAYHLYDDAKDQKVFGKDVEQKLEILDNQGTTRVTKDGHSLTRKVDDDDALDEDNTKAETEKQNEADAKKKK
jgi:hypothetical protein